MIRTGCILLLLKLMLLEKIATRKILHAEYHSCDSLIKCKLINLAKLVSLIHCGKTNRMVNGIKIVKSEQKVISESYLPSTRGPI